MWRSIRDALEGVNSVKRANEIYLPMPLGFEVDDTAPSASMHISPTVTTRSETDDYDFTASPYWHPNPAYRAYLQRARFPEITMHTLRGLIGVATRKQSNIDLPSKIQYLEDKATRKGKSLDELFAYCLAEVLSQGRVTLVLDVKKDNTVCIVPYKTENFINWDDDESTSENLFSVFQEIKYVAGEGKEFETEQQTVNIVYSFDVSKENSKRVLVRKFIDDVEDVSKTVTPSLQGRTFEKIPVVTIGSLNNDSDPDPAPLLGVSEIAYSIYRKDADLSQAEYMTCNPMFTITGTDGNEGVPAAFGSTVALILENPAANAFFPSTDTSALAHVTNRIERMFEEAANYGASLLGPTKKAAESTDTLKVRQGAQGATLVGVVENVCTGITDILKLAAEIHGANPEDVSYSVPTDFSEASLSPQMLLALITLWQSGGMSKETLLKIVKESGFGDRDEEVEEEMARIFAEPPALTQDDV